MQNLRLNVRFEITEMTRDCSFLKRLDLIVTDCLEEIATHTHSVHNAVSVQVTQRSALLREVIYPSPTPFHIKSFAKQKIHCAIHCSYRR